MKRSDPLSNVMKSSSASPALVSGRSASNWRTPYFRTYLPKEDVLAALRAAGVEPTRRAETLTLADWAKVEEALSSRGELI